MEDQTPQQPKTIENDEISLEMLSISDSTNNNNNNNINTHNSNIGHKWFDNIIEYQKENLSHQSNNIDQQRLFTQQYSEKRSFYLNEDNNSHTTPTTDPTVLKDFNQNVFSSSLTIYNRHQQFNNSSIPNGFMVSPFYYPIITPTSYQYSPPRCKSCNSFINIYCKLTSSSSSSSTSTSTNSTASTNKQTQQQTIKKDQWKCSICHFENIIDDGKSGVRNILDVVTGLGWWNTDHYKSVFSNESFDIKKKKSDPVDNSTSFHQQQHLTGMSIDESLLPTTATATNNRSTYLSATGDKPLYNTYFFLIDENISTKDLDIIRQSIQRFIKELPTNTFISLITFSKNISIYELHSSSSTADNSNNILFTSARLIGGSQSLPLDYKRDLKAKYRKYFERVDKDGQVRLFDAAFTSIVENSENNGDQVVYESKPISLGVAIECSLALVPTQELINGRMFIYLNGSPDYGPGAVPLKFSGSSSVFSNDQTMEEQLMLNNAYIYYKELGIKSYHKGISIDLSFMGYNDFSCPTLLGLTQPSGFINYSLPIQDNDRVSMLYDNLKNSVDKNTALYAKLDIYKPEFVELTHIIGPTIDKESNNNKDYPNYFKSFNQDIFKNDNQQQQQQDDQDNQETGFIISNLQQDICFSIYYKTLEDIPNDYVCFQFVTNIINQNGERISRVITKRIKTTGNFDKYLSSLDFNVISILLSKRIVLESLKLLSQPSSSSSQPKQKQLLLNQTISQYLQYQLDKQLGSIVLSCSKVEKGWWFGRKTVTVSDRMKSFIRKIYSMRKSLVYGSTVQNQDDLVIFQSILLHSNYLDSIKLLYPKLLQFNLITKEFRNIPLDNCSINQDSILMLDSFCTIYILIGTNVFEKVQNGDQLKDLYSYIDILKSYRIPSPFIITFNQDQNEVRWLRSILNCSDSYPIDERIEIIKEIYPNINIDSSNIKQFDSIFPSDDQTPAQYERYIISTL
ncbi:hypothetical protein CYY_004480 [Polysphondylium violaceum]|uniref:Sec23/Sec24 trunk domain-containing protein n=1 Tax=Polysphondylium violaceum TaxID=133409 RepID=A0A8J4PWT0_9MYCE|nr:hypothetical protein CYY_004480 [Polysphondylium violaceum]